MKISAAQAYCILDTVGSSILTKSGEISVSYLLELPEAYSLDRWIWRKGITSYSGLSSMSEPGLYISRTCFYAGNSSRNM